MCCILPFSRNVLICAIEQTILDTRLRGCDNVGVDEDNESVCRTKRGCDNESVCRTERECDLAGVNEDSQSECCAMRVGDIKTLCHAYT